MSRTKKSRGFQPAPSPPPREPSRRDVDRAITAEYIGGALTDALALAKARGLPLVTFIASELSDEAKVGIFDEIEPRPPKRA